MIPLRRHLLKKKKNIYLSVSCDGSQSFGPTTCLSICDWYCYCFLCVCVGLKVGFLLISVNLSQKDIPPGSSRKAVICALIGVLCLVSPAV